MDDMIQAIQNAELEAAQIKNNALDRAQQIVDEARAKALKLEADAAKARTDESAEILRKAELSARDEYSSFIEKKRRDAETYADGIRSTTDVVVGKIVGRVSGGNR
jgi:vacuolar-type H+-ATPase subunit H